MKCFISFHNFQDGDPKVVEDKPAEESVITKVIFSIVIIL